VQHVAKNSRVHSLRRGSRELQMLAQFAAKLNDNYTAQ
jgi:hypothetical protein